MGPPPPAASPAPPPDAGLPIIFACLAASMAACQLTAAPGVALCSGARPTTPSPWLTPSPPPPWSPPPPPLSSLGRREVKESKGHGFVTLKECNNKRGKPARAK
ncbi:hypothetical protein EYF80_024572 [Liparis tanakae]|uniref:Uncharacterized protein n=1 Tax=Liparis tanakae TaxID=230148 RepID=A0A4Z2HIS2_9TELE|nr:hypothetical protein EYF80_024572 [Liparis tanakae]